MILSPYERTWTFEDAASNVCPLCGGVYGSDCGSDCGTGHDMLVFGRRRSLPNRDVRRLMAHFRRSSAQVMADLAWRDIVDPLPQRLPWALAPAKDLRVRPVPVDVPRARSRAVTRRRSVLARQWTVKETP